MSDAVAGTGARFPWRAVRSDEVELLFDVTYRAPGGERRIDQQLFDRAFEIVEAAETYLVLDFFLVNDFAGDAARCHRALSSELCMRLLERRGQRPSMPILFVTDPINTVYGGERHDGLEALSRAGVDVVMTDLLQLPDSNPLYSKMYRLLFRGAGNDVGQGALPNPFDPRDRVTLRSWLALLNFKANHRKVIVAGRRNAPPLAWVASANPHDASSAHGNAGVCFAGAAALDLLESELAVARFSGWRGQIESGVAQEATGGDGRLRVVTEGAIGASAEGLLDSAQGGDEIELSMFYLGHRDVVGRLVAAARRGARVRLVLDANRDAFGLPKNGVPNRPVARELLRRTRRCRENLELRWYRTSGEQFHTKLLVVRRRDRTGILLGSANFTRRNLDDLNLETDVELDVPRDSAPCRRAGAFFHRIWSNRDGTYTRESGDLPPTGVARWWLYRLQERTGLSTF